MDVFHKIPEDIKHVGDMASVSIMPFAWLELLNPIVAFITIIWMTIRIYETDTIQKLIGNKKKDE